MNDYLSFDATIVIKIDKHKYSISDVLELMSKNKVKINYSGEFFNNPTIVLIEDE